MNALREWRKSLPKPMRSQAAVGKLFGVSAAQVSRYENDRKRVPPEKAAAYERITGIPKEVLRPDVFGPVKRKATAA